MSFLAPRRRERRPLGWLATSATAHLVVGGLLVAAPALWTQPPPLPAPLGATVIELELPAAAPLPLPKGDPSRRETPERTPRSAPRPSESEPTDVRVAWRAPESVPPELAEPEWGSETGEDFGVPEGMDGGVPDGVVGGTPNGRPGGSPFGSGAGPGRFDRQPRLLHQTRPVYPAEAFVKKIQGRVVLQILIGVDGRVQDVRVLESVPALDAAAIRTVRQWRFEPALLRGRPVSSWARTPIDFTIY
jgi:protein TonB